MAGFLSMTIFAGCQQGAPAATNQQGSSTNVASTGGGKLVDGSCDTLSPADLSAIVDIPSDQLASPKAMPLNDGQWTCTYGSSGQVYFTVTMVDSVAQAASDMEDYRSNLETAAANIPDGKYPNGAYSDIGGLGDDAVYSAVNNSLDARQGTVSILVMAPNDKLTQISIADAFFKKLQ